MLALGTKGDRGSWKNEWMVMPPALMAATPVGATMMLRFLLRSLRVRRNVVLPVPAFPVRKMLIPVCSTKSHALRSSWFFSMLLSVCLFERTKVMEMSEKSKLCVLDESQAA